MARKNGLGRGIDALLLENDEETKDQGVLSLRVSQIEPKVGQPRKHFENEALSQLAESIAAHGVLQPILVRELIDGRYQIIAGERRWRAAKLAGLSEIPAILMDSDEKQSSQIALIENIQREDLNPMEEAMAYRSLQEEYQMTQEEISTAVGKSRSAIANFTRLLDLPESVQTLVTEGLLSSGHARTLLGLKNKADIQVLGQKAAEQGYSVRMLEEEVRKWNKRAELPPKEEEPPTFQVDYVAELERKMMSNLGRKVKISSSRGKKSVTLFFEDNQDLDALLRKICGDDFVSEL